MTLRLSLAAAGQGPLLRSGGRSSHSFSASLVAEQALGTRASGLAVSRQLLGASELWAQVQWLWHRGLSGHGV